MDYAFIPGIGDSDLEAEVDLLHHLPQTAVDLAPQPTALSTFLAAVNMVIQGAGFGPAGSLIITAHGDLEGHFSLSLDPSTQPPATYEKIQNSTSISIPPAVKDANTSVQLTSCLLGSKQTAPLLQALKTAMGNPKSVTAPRYLHAIWGPKDGAPFGMWEYMMYQFVILGKDPGKDPLTSRDDVVKKFSAPASGFQYFDGTNIPASKWQDWVPSPAQIKLDTDYQIFFFPLPVVVPIDFAGIQTSVSIPFFAAWVSWHEKIPVPNVESDYIPAGDDTIADTLIDLLPASFGEYRVGHLYPVYTRYNYKTLKDFAYGLHWKVNYGPGTSKKYVLQCVGTRYRYELWIPVTNPSTNELIHNYFPDSGAPTINMTASSQPLLFGVA